MEDLLKHIKQIANNALYFNDSSDYESALWNILELCGEEAENHDELRFIEDYHNA